MTSICSTYTNFQPTLVDAKGVIALKNLVSAGGNS